MNQDKLNLKKFKSDMYHIISTGSKGNAILYHKSILLDCGVPFSSIKPYLYDIQLVLLTHVHGDHYNDATIKRMILERPSVRIGYCNDWFTIQGRNIDRYELNQVYDYGIFQISPFRLYHDVPNCGYRIFKNETKIFHATDTSHLEGITAKGSDLYAIEHNYNEETVFETIHEIEERGGFAHQRGSINSHLSEQQANEFFLKNKKEESIIIRLHESSTSL